MKLAVIGSRGIIVEDIERYLPDGIDEIVSGGARGADLCAKEYAVSRSIKYTEFLPDYNRYGRAAPIKRNDEIINYADEIIAFWDGASKGTQYTVKRAQKLGKKVTVIIL
ncbi:MAG: DUF2493 domain-containing protein [Clostridiales bacterium]|nr:DUF2493 domain-containing protein [Clostridiales bacterium]